MSERPTITNQAVPRDNRRDARVMATAGGYLRAAEEVSLPQVRGSAGGCRESSTGTVAKSDLPESGRRSVERAAAAIVQSANLPESNDGGGSRPRCSAMGILRITAHRLAAPRARSIPREDRG